MNTLKENLISKATALENNKPTMFDYVHLKIKERDLHGAIDGLMDLRDIDSEIKAIEEMLKELE